MNRRQYGGAVLAVFIIAVALRLGSLFWSPLPYNPDGIIYADMARDAVRIGRLPLDGMPTDSLGFTSLLTVVARVTGHPPLYVGQGMAAVVGAVTVLVAVALGRRLTAGWWPAHRARVGGVVAGLLLTVDGLYLYRSMATDETTVDLLFVPVLAVAIGRALASGDRRWAVVALVLFVAIPPMHNVGGLISALVVTGAFVVRIVDRTTVRTVVGTVATGAAVWVWMLGYHPGMAALTPTTVIQTGRLTDAPGLFVAWVVILLIGGGWFIATTSRMRRGIIGGTLVGGFGLLALNAVTLVFPATMTTSPLLLIMLLPLAIPALLATVSLGPVIETDVDGTGTAVFALLAGPMVLIGFSLSAGLTPDYLATIFRAHLFVHLPFIVLVPSALFAALRRLDLPGRRTLRVVGVVLLILCAGASVPVAFAGLEVRPYKTITSPVEFAGVEFASERVTGPWTTDDHLARVAGYHGDGPLVAGRAGRIRSGGAVSKSPVLGWLLDGGPPPDCPVLAQRSWTTTGAQFYPRSPVRISPRAFANWLSTNEVVYAAGHRDPVIVVRSQSPTRSEC